MVSLEDIKQAQAELPPAVVKTPTLFSEDLSKATGSRVYFKCENLQVTGSYKARAAFTILNRLAEGEKQRGAALTSSGNFASAFAYMGRLLNIPTTVVMMQKTSPFKVEKCQRYGAEVILCDDRFDARFEVLERLRQERGITAINHFEDPNVIAGHGTIGLEMLEELPEAEVVLVPVSSGGLIAGIATAVKGTNPKVKVIGVQPQGSNAMYLSFQRGEVVRIPKVETICDALMAQYPGYLPFEHVLKYVDEMVLITDEDVKAAVRWLLEHTKLIVEPGGAVGVAALQAGKVNAKGKTVHVLLSGGNIAPSLLADIISVSVDD